MCTTTTTPGTTKRVYHWWCSSPSPRQDNTYFSADAGEFEGEEGEDMEAERDLAFDAQWKRIQQNTFTRWANEHLKTIDQTILNLETDLCDGLRLIALIEVLSQKRMPKHNKRPTFRSQKLENIAVALKFLEDEGIKIINIGESLRAKVALHVCWAAVWRIINRRPAYEGRWRVRNDIIDFYNKFPYNSKKIWWARSPSCYLCLVWSSAVSLVATVLLSIQALMLQNTLEDKNNYWASEHSSYGFLLGKRSPGDRGFWMQFYGLAKVLFGFIFFGSIIILANLTCFKMELMMNDLFIKKIRDLRLVIRDSSFALVSKLIESSNTYPPADIFLLELFWFIDEVLRSFDVLARHSVRSTSLSSSSWLAVAAAVHLSNYVDYSSKVVNNFSFLWEHTCTGETQENRTQVEWSGRERERGPSQLIMT